MKVLILGSGYIGNHLFNYFKTRYDTVEQVSQKTVDYTYTNLHNSSIDFKSYLNDKRFDVAINCSGYTGYPNVDACETNKDKCWEYNVLAPVKTAETLNLYRIPMIHISSGCIYEGSFDFNEKDTPNFGLYDDHSSFYSKSKHAGELALNGMNGFIARIRMPFCTTVHHKNILYKYLKYNDIISMNNSLTYIRDLAKCIDTISLRRESLKDKIYNIVNRGSITAERVIEIMREEGLNNPNWNIVNITDLKLKAGRSNCTLSCNLISEHYELQYVEDTVRYCAQQLKKKISDA